MNLENIMLNDRSWTQKATYCRTAFISNVHNGQMLRDRKQVAGAKGWGGGKG